MDNPKFTEEDYREFKALQRAVKSGTLDTCPIGKSAIVDCYVSIKTSQRKVYEVINRVEKKYGFTNLIKDLHSALGKVEVADMAMFATTIRTLEAMEAHGQNLPGA